ncbi:MAG TPA: ECF-type sigma factor [Longimicrobiales bacterium]|nr:ECF-type sigma factor [Longimicrobiales bacterium]
MSTSVQSKSSRPRQTLDALVPEVYEELRRIAHRDLKAERADHTFGTTALVHEAYLKLARLERVTWQNREHFCAEAARAMRRILIDYAIRRSAIKRGGNQVHVRLDETLVLSDDNAEQLIALDAALHRLADTHPRLARIVECRFFAGMTVPEIATVMELSPATVKRDWQLARAWLNRELA